MATKQKTKTRQFDVPKEFIGTFFSNLEETELDYSIIEYDHDNDELIVYVDYTPDEREEVMDLIELSDDYNTEDEDLRGTEEN